MLELPDLATLTDTLTDGRFLAAAVVAALAGVVRGFSGFGSALIYVPLIAAVYEPRIATVSFALMDYVCVLPYALRAFPQARWREVTPAFAAAFLTVPLGTMAQNAADPIVLRWGMTVARRAPDRFSQLLAGGMTATIFFYVAINLLMVMGLAPVVGIPLPFMSHGGSSMMTNMICLGTLMMVDRWSRRAGRTGTLS